MPDVAIACLPLIYFGIISLLLLASCSNMEVFTTETETPAVQGSPKPQLYGNLPV